MELNRKLKLVYDIKGIIPEELKEDAALQAAFYNNGTINDEEYLNCLTNADLLKYDREDFKFTLTIQERHVSF